MHRYCPKSSTNCCEILYTKWIFPDPGHTRDARLQSYQWSPQWSPSIATYSVPAPWAPQVCLFTVFPHSGIPKYRYLQCLPTLGTHKGCQTSKLSVILPVIPKYRYLQCSRTLGSPSIVIYSVPGLWAPQGALVTVFPHPGLPKYRYLYISRN